jgi:4-amino-4-deoxy-L-arabinose transferase-like glycosyltransferase
MTEELVQPDEGGRLSRLRFRRRYAALAGILLVAVFMRFWQLDSLPPGLYHDEAYNGLDALSLLNSETFPIFYEGWELYAEDAHRDRPVEETQDPIFFEGNFGREPLHIYLMALSIAIFGPTPFAIRAVPAAAGVLAVLTTFLAADILLGRGQREGMRDRYRAWIPLFSAFIMAIFYPAVSFSRFGIRAMLFVPISTAAVYSLGRGVRAVDENLRDDSDTPFTSFDVRLGTFKPGWFIAAGFFLGLGLYTYAAARIFPFLFVAFVVMWFWRDRQVLRAHWGNMTVMVVTGFLVALPLLLFFLRYPYFLVFRSRFVANRGSRIVRLGDAEKLLTSHQYDLLLALAERAGRVLSRETLADLVRNDNAQAYDPALDRSIDVHIARIRAAIEHDPKHPRRILTVRGVGYVFAKAQS